MKEKEYSLKHLSQHIYIQAFSVVGSYFQYTEWWDASSQGTYNKIHG